MLTYQAPTRTYWPNAYGLYNMAGNVSEWVMDVYRPLIDQTTTDLNPYRGNVYETWTRDEDRFLVEKDSLGRMIKERTCYMRRLWKQKKLLVFWQHQFLRWRLWFSIKNRWLVRTNRQANTTNDMYEFGKTSLVTDNSKVYKEDHGMTELIGWFQELEDSLTNLYQRFNWIPLCYGLDWASNKPIKRESTQTCWLGRKKGY